MKKITTHIREYFKEEFNFPITPQHARMVKVFRMNFEARGDNAAALNTAAVGVTKIYFKKTDQEWLFSIFGVDKNAFKKVIEKIPSIDKSFKVTSDPYNLLTVWVLHLITKTDKKVLNDNQKTEMMTDLIKLMLYKFFTSFVNYMLPNGANEDVMTATIESLTNKSDLATRGSWKADFDYKASEIASPTTLHSRSIREMHDDALVLRIISDTQTGVRNKVKKIVLRYYQMKEEGDKIKSYDIVSTIDGEKIIKSSSKTFDSMIAYISNTSLNTNAFIDMKVITFLSKWYGQISPAMLKNVLVKFSNQAVIQSRESGLDIVKTTGKKDIEYYIGSRILISKIIEVTYRQCLNSGIDLGEALAVLQKTKNMYSSSRITNPAILSIKQSVSDFVDSTRESSREATKTSLRLAFITYIIILSFKRL